MADNARIAQFQKLVEQNPNDDMAQFSLGSALLEAGRADEAGPCFQRVLAVNSQHSKAYEMLGRVQIDTGHSDLAIETLTNGYRMAHRKGDLMPAKAMAELLTSLGAEVPSVAPARGAETDGGTAAAASGDFACRRCGAPGPRMERRPFKGPLGETILATVCGRCWKEWVGMGTKVINELRLPMFDPQAQELYDKHMKEFLLIE
jgi:Fe-S cluster biosynthesis and repair protein YggX